MPPAARQPCTCVTWLITQSDPWCSDFHYCNEAGTPLAGLQEAKPEEKCVGQWQKLLLGIDSAEEKFSSIIQAASERQKK